MKSMKRKLMMLPVVAAAIATLGLVSGSWAFGGHAVPHDTNGYVSVLAGGIDPPSPPDF